MLECNERGNGLESVIRTYCSVDIIQLQMYGV